MKNTVKPIIFAVELLIVLCNFFIVYFFLRHFNFFFKLDLIPSQVIVRSPKSLEFYWSAFWASTVIWFVILWWRRGYQDLHVQTTGMVIQHLVFNGLLFLFLFTSVSFLLKLDDISRIFIISYSASTTVLLIINRLIFLEAEDRKSVV